jgi:hypothetical protein
VILTARPEGSAPAYSPQSQALTQAQVDGEPEEPVKPVPPAAPETKAPQSNDVPD